MQALVNDLLAYARLGSRGKPFEPTDLAAAFAQAVANLDPAIRESGAGVTQTGLPKVWGDGSQLVQLLQNLLGNALKFRGDKSPVVQVAARRAEGREPPDSGGDWLFSVRDNGIGIDPRYAERIFIIFERLHSPAEYPGTGIGLAICKKIVQRHGGKIWVESALGAGATFYFTLPSVEGHSP
jgi:light-regulated signal transduction histidine kinase (bacteriophytochrome)